MARKLTTQEKYQLVELPIVIPRYQSQANKNSTQPFNIGADPTLYREDELKKKVKTQSPRTEWFERRLIAIWRELGGDVPYAFRIGRAVRSLDAGCLGFLINRNKPELALRKDSEGYVVAVTPVGPLTSRYSSVEKRLRQEIRPPDPDTPDDLSGAPPQPSNELPPLAGNRETDVAAEIVDLAKDDSLEDTERVKLIAARIGQGIFRAQVLERWNNCCALTGCELRPVLRASHIKPWCNSTNDERLNPENGLPLTANIDALFDRGLISFDDGGNVLFSSRLEAKHRALVPEPRTLSKPLTATARKFMAEHRKASGFG